MNFQKYINIYLCAIVLAIIVNVFSWHLPFFWDTILTSTITQHFYEQGFHNFIIPAQFDAGHPPLFYIYVSSFYHFFGKSLVSAHLSMLPVTILGIISFIQILQYFSYSKAQQIFGVVLYFSIPAVITQNTLVSYDAVLLSLYLAALVSYLKKRKIIFALIVFLITGITLRGLFCLGSLSITIYYLENRNPKKWFKWNLLFIPAVLLIGAWYCYHYSQTGWFFATKSEGWREQRGFVNAFGIFKNSISIARCFFDLGVFMLSFLCLFYFIQKKKIDNYTLLWLIPMVVFSISFLPFSNPINHRYYLIVYVLMLFSVIQFLSERKKVYSIVTIVILMLGHVQIYPVPISNGWDCTLAHLNYLAIKDSKFIVFGVNNGNIGTVFPMNASLKQSDMINDTVRMININGKPIDSVQYVLFSNVGNDFSDEQIKILKSWKELYYSKSGLVKIILYQNPKFYQK